MMTVHQYIETTGEKRRNVYLKLSDGRLRSLKVNNQTLIISGTELTALSDERKKVFVTALKEEWNLLVMKAHYNQSNKELRAATIKKITDEVKYYEEHLQMKIVGYDQRSLYRKIETGKLERKSRTDKFSNKNPILKIGKVQRQIMELAAYVYIENAQPNVRFTALRIKEMAEQLEDYYEIASDRLPFSTLYKFVENFITNTGLKELHQWANHFSQWYHKQPKCTGAFTSDVNFMDYYAVDDRKCDVSGAWYFDELDNKKKLRTVYIWRCIEMQTMKNLGWIIKPFPLNEQDVINVFSQAFSQYGLPRKGILLDNGIGTSSGVLSFINKVAKRTNTEEYFTEGYKPGPPYEPTYKSNIELSNNLIKKEFDTRFRNFVGGSRNEVRHTDKRLSPEECEITVREYIERCDKYLLGEYDFRKRDRVIKGNKQRASIKELFDKSWTDFAPCIPEDSTMRFANLKTDIVRTLKNTKVSITVQGIVNDFIPSVPLPGVLNEKQFYIAFHPLRMDTIDLFATCDILDAYTGNVWNRGDYVCTLDNMRFMSKKQKLERIYMLRKQSQQEMKKVANTYLNLTLAENPGLIDKINSTVEVDGKLIDTRRQVLKKVNEYITENIPMNNIAGLVEQHGNPEPAEAGKDLTYETEQESKLTFESE